MDRCLRNKTVGFSCLQKKYRITVWKKWLGTVFIPKAIWQWLMAGVGPPKSKKCVKWDTSRSCYILETRTLLKCLLAFVSARVFVTSSFFCCSVWAWGFAPLSLRSATPGRVVTLSPLRFRLLLFVQTHFFLQGSCLPDGRVSESEKNWRFKLEYHYADWTTNTTQSKFKIRNFFLKKKYFCCILHTKHIISFVIEQKLCSIWICFKKPSFQFYFMCALLQFKLTRCFKKIT